MKNQMELFNKGEFEMLYQNFAGDQDLMAVLAQMQTSHGIHGRKAWENADAMIRLVAAHESLSAMITDDAMDALDNFLNHSQCMTGYDRKVMLHQLYFGLKLYQDDTLMERVKEGATESQLFREYFTRWGEDPSVTDQMLESDIREMMSRYHISPKAMKAIASRMEKNQDMLASASALGQDGQRFKCIVAMDLYLRGNGTMTMDEAVSTACTNVELGAVADAVSRGRITEERAKKIIAVVAICCILFSILMAMFAPQILTAAAHILVNPTWVAANSAAPQIAAQGVATAAAVAKASVMSAQNGLMLGGIAIAAVKNTASQWMGRLVANRTFVRASAADAAAAMDAMADRDEAENAAVRASFPEASEEITVQAHQAAQAFA